MFALSPFYTYLREIIFNFNLFLQNRLLNAQYIYIWVCSYSMEFQFIIIHTRRKSFSTEYRALTKTFAREGVLCWRDHILIRRSYYAPSILIISVDNLNLYVTSYVYLYVTICDIYSCLCFMFKSENWTLMEWNLHPENLI